MRWACAGRGLGAVAGAMPETAPLPSPPAGRTSARVLLCGAFVAWLALCCAGCGRGSNAPPRFDVSGQVTFDGKPVPSGSIYFEADGSRGNAGPVSIVGIDNGRYDTKAARVAGPVQGPLIVRITGNPPLEPGGDPRPPLFPEHTTTVELVPGRGPNTFDFEVPSRRQPKAAR